MIIFSACQSPVSHDVYNYGEEFELAIGEEVETGAENSSVKFVDIVKDSRCPINVMCVWAGNGKVQI